MIMKNLTSSVLSVALILSLVVHSATHWECKLYTVHFKILIIQCHHNNVIDATNITLQHSETLGGAGCN